ncbi:MAG: hypothetical protein KAU12_04650 [Candidatus Omnitrophica bacterium]|nr:hypothetical protein [Candidatus Omnitrophota bacterium]
MAQYEVKLPELGEGIEKAAVSFWHYEAGEKVNENDDLVEVITEKAAFNVPSPASGKLIKVLFEEGDEIRINETIALIETQ